MLGTFLTAAGKSQPVSFTGTNVTLKQVFSEIEKQTGYVVFANKKDLDRAKRVTLHTKNTPLREFLTLLTKDQNLDFIIKDKTIVLSEKAVPAAAERNQPVKELVSNTAPPVNIRILDINGEPMAGASVSVLKSKQSGITNSNGIIELEVKEGDNLTISYIGYESSNYSITRADINSSSITITLTPSENKLDDIEITINTGYQNLNRGNFPGAVSKIAGKDLPPTVASSVDQLIQGFAAGLQVVNSSGDPSEMGLTLIRGRSGLHDDSYLNRPLYVVDGYILSDDMLNTINPNDIESIEILRDAGATSIYGARGGNGVFVITTKRAKAGKIDITYNGSLGYNLVPDLTKRYMNTSEKIAFEMKNNGYASKLTQEQRDSLSEINTDWQSYLLRQGLVQNHNISLGGGTERSNYNFSAGYQDNEGTVKSTFFKRYSGLFRFSSQVSKHFNINMRIQGVATRGGSVLNNYSNTASPLKVLAYANPYETPFNADGSIKNKLNNGLANPLYEIDKAKLRSSNNTVNLSTRAELKVPFVDGLRIYTNITGSYTISNIDNKYWPGSYQTNFSNKSQLDFTENKIANINSTTAISYNPEIGKDHDLTMAVFYEFRNNRSDGLRYRVYGFNEYVPNLSSVPITADNINILRNMGYETAISSYFTNISYSYKKKYNLQLTGRRDGSSLFGQNNQFGWFGAIAGMWNIKEESFLKQSNVVSGLRLRSSLGNSGDMVGIGNQATFDRIEIEQYNGQSAFNLAAIANKSVSWAERVKANIGFDFGLFANRISGNINLYHETIDNAFVSVPIPPSSGFDNMSRNLAGIKNNGLEVELSVDIIRKKDIGWTVNGNFSHNKNEITSLRNLNSISYIGGITQVGHPFRSMYVIKYMGVDPETGAPLYEGENGEPTTRLQYLNYARIMGPVDAPYFGGFASSLRYKQWNLRANFAYNIGNDVINIERYSDENTPDLSYNQSKLRENYWTVKGDISDLPKPGGYEINRYTDRYLEKGSFTRLKLLQLDYRLPSTVIQKLKMNDVSLYLAGTNLLVFTDFKGTDPEFVDGVLSGGQYPVQKSIIFGLNVRF
jgi:TonB-linked SusC/RagA family outer membrane protein